MRLRIRRRPIPVQQRNRLKPPAYQVLGGIATATQALSQMTRLRGCHGLKPPLRSIRSVMSLPSQTLEKIRIPRCLRQIARGFPIMAFDVFAGARLDQNLHDFQVASRDSIVERRIAVVAASRIYI